MKKKDLEKQLREEGWRFARHGGNHDAWTNGELFEFVPRHAEVYRDRLNSSLFHRARQSLIEANFIRAPSDEHHSQIGKGEEEDRLGKVAAGQKVKNSTDLGINEMLARKILKKARANPPKEN